MLLAAVGRARQEDPSHAVDSEASRGFGLCSGRHDTASNHRIGENVPVGLVDEIEIENAVSRLKLLCPPLHNSHGGDSGILDDTHPVVFERLVLHRTAPSGWHVKIPGGSNRIGAAFRYIVRRVLELPQSWRGSSGQYWRHRGKIISVTCEF